MNIFLFRFLEKVHLQ